MAETTTLTLPCDRQDRIEPLQFPTPRSDRRSIETPAPALVLEISDTL